MFRNHLHGAFAGQHFYPRMLSEIQSISTSPHQFSESFRFFQPNNKQPIETNNDKQLREILEKVAGKEIVKRDLRRHVHLLTITHSKEEEFGNLVKLAKDIETEH